MRKRRLTTNTFLARSAGISRVRSWRFRTRRLLEVNPDEQLAKANVGSSAKVLPHHSRARMGRMSQCLVWARAKGDQKHAIARQVKRKAAATSPYDCT